MSEKDLPHKRKTVLLAEDDASMRRFLEIILKNAGFEVIAEEDGLAAMQTAFNTSIDAVIADAIMPNMTGYDLCRMLRNNPDKKDIPLVILSGLDSTNEANLADAYLVKGENLKEDLLKTLSNFFS
jgi:DNA-binding response OmpR family regulator